MTFSVMGSGPVKRLPVGLTGPDPGWAKIRFVAPTAKCPLCGIRPARRRCPALGQTICAVCCGTKRQVEIRCTPDCPYLASAKEHPPAVVKRQHEQDVSLLMPAVAELTDRQSRFFFLFQSIVARQPDAALRPLVDADVAEAAASLARTLETSARGVIYEQTPQSLPAQELMASLRRAYDEVVGTLEGPRTPLERDAAKALAALADAARRVGPLSGDERRGLLALARRLLRPAPGETAEPGDGGAPPAAGSIIVP